MSAQQSTPESIQFGLTTVEVMVGELVQQHVEAIIVGANSRGIMGAGPAGTLRTAAGEQIEREVMARAPIDPGTAIVTGPGDLMAIGVKAIIHTSLTAIAGRQPTPPALERAVDAALAAADTGKHRQIALPLLGVSANADPDERRAAAELIVASLVAHLRRRSGRLDLVRFVLPFEDDVPMLLETIRNARQRAWS